MKTLFDNALFGKLMKELDGILKNIETHEEEIFIFEHEMKDSFYRTILLLLDEEYLLLQSKNFNGDEDNIKKVVIIPDVANFISADILARNTFVNAYKVNSNKKLELLKYKGWE